MSVLFMKLANIVVKPQDCSRTFIMPIFPIIIMIEFIWKNGFIKKEVEKIMEILFLMEVKED